MADNSTAADRRRPASLRRGIAALAIVALMVVSVFPRAQVSRVKVMPPQDSQAGLGALLNQLGGLASFASLVGARQPAEVYLILARSNDVAEDVVRRLSKSVRNAPDSTLALARWTDVHTLRGGVVEIEASGTDAVVAKAITTAYAGAFQDRLSALAREEITRKKRLMSEKLLAASTQLAQAEAAMTSYRTNKHIASVEGQVSASIGLLTQLRARLQAKEVELTMARQFLTSQNMAEQRIQAEINGLRRQIAETESAANGKSDPFGLQNFASQSSDYLRLFRDLKYAEALYEVYARFSESINVEEMSSSLNAQVIESPYVDPAIRPRAWPLGLAGLVLLGLLLLEYRARGVTSLHGEAPNTLLADE